MKLLNIIMLALCLNVPIAHTGNDFQCSSGAYVGSTILTCTGILLTVGACVAHREAVKFSKKDVTLCKGLVVCSSLLGACGTYCLATCINQY